MFIAHSVNKEGFRDQELRATLDRENQDSLYLRGSINIWLLKEPGIATVSGL